MVIDRSALVSGGELDDVLSFELLFPLTGSFTADETVAVLDIGPGVDGAVAFIAIDGAAPGARLEGSVQLTKPVLCTQFQPAALKLVNVTPAGSVSDTDTLVAVLGPLLVTASVYVIAPLVVTVSGPVFMIDRSDDDVTFVPAVLLLLEAIGSPTLEDTVAELLIVPPSDLAKTVITMIGAVVPDVRLVLVQVTTSELSLHVQPVPTALTYVTPGGK